MATIAQELSYENQKQEVHMNAKLIHLHNIVGEGLTARPPSYTFTIECDESEITLRRSMNPGARPSNRWQDSKSNFGDGLA